MRNNSRNSNSTIKSLFDFPVAVLRGDQGPRRPLW